MALAIINDSQDKGVSVSTYQKFNTITRICTAFTNIQQVGQEKYILTMKGKKGEVLLLSRCPTYTV